MNNASIVVPDYKLKPENQECDAREREDTIRNLAYLKWLAATGGNPVDQEASVGFWVEAEKEIDGQCS